MEVHSITKLLAKSAGIGFHRSKSAAWENLGNRKNWGSDFPKRELALLSFLLLFYPAMHHLGFFDV